MVLQYILDILVVLLAALGIGVGIHQGFFKMFFAKFGKITSVFFALLIAKPFGKLLTVSFFSDKIANLVFNMAKLEELAPAASSEELLASVPWFVRFMARIVGYDLEVASNAAFNSGKGMYHTIIADLTYPIASFISFIICFVILIFLIRLVIKLLVRFSEGIFELPVISVINKVAGAIFGVCLNAIILWIVCKLLVGVVSINAIANSPAMSNFNIENTFIAKYIYHFNPLAFLLSIK